MGAFTSALLAGSTALNIFGQFKEGQQAQEAANFNAAIYQQNRQIIDINKELTKSQFDRAIKFLKGKTVAATAAAGIDFSGSALEVFNDNVTQAELQKQQALFDLEVSGIRATDAAEESRRAGIRVSSAATTGALTSILTEGNDFFQRFGFSSKATPTAKERAAQMSLLPEFR